MAKTSKLTIDPELEDRYYSSLQTMDRFVIPRIRAKTGPLSKAKINKLKARSNLNAISTLWNNFTDEQQTAWKTVDPHFQKHGYRTFCADQNQRIKNGIAGVATPNEYHQDLVGKILIQAPAEEIKLSQLHPSSYWINYKVPGKKNMFEPVEVEEGFALPLVLAINYKSDLTSTGAGSFARFYATVRRLYQGQNLDQDLIVEIPLSSGWAEGEEELTEVVGVAIFYNLYIHLYKVTGTLLIDNVRAVHSAVNLYSDYGLKTYGSYKYADWSGQNWARDPFCKEIDQSFKRGFSLVPNHWDPITLPSGASYESIYPT